MDTQSENNTVYIGTKPVLNYVLACLTLFQNGSGEVILKARGRAISTAVDAAMITMQRYASDARVNSIAIDTEEFKDAESGVVTSLSTIEIKLSK